MRIPFSLYDFLGYTLPGTIVMAIILILINPGILEHSPNSTKDGLAGYLPTTVVQCILYMFAGYLIGFIIHGGSEAFFKFASKWKRLKKLHTDNGWFMKGLFKPEFRDSSEDFNPYSDQFVCQFKNQIEEIFTVKVKKIKRDVEYTEIFDFCRSILIKQSPTLYARAFVLFARHESAKLMMSISVLATLAFSVRSIHLWISSESTKWFVTILTGVSFLLVFLFFYMYKRLLRYYRNTILYGFYEYAVTREKSENHDN